MLYCTVALFESVLDFNISWLQMIDYLSLIWVCCVPVWSVLLIFIFYASPHHSATTGLCILLVHGVIKLKKYREMARRYE